MAQSEVIVPSRGDCHQNAVQLLENASDLMLNTFGDEDAAARDASAMSMVATAWLMLAIQLPLEEDLTDLVHERRRDPHAG